MATSLAAAMLACCAGIFLANFLGLTGSSLGFAALCASGMASLAGMWTGNQGKFSSIFSGKQIRSVQLCVQPKHSQAAYEPTVEVYRLSDMGYLLKTSAAQRRS